MVTYINNVARKQENRKSATYGVHSTWCISSRHVQRFLNKMPVVRRILSRPTLTRYDKNVISCIKTFRGGVQAVLVFMGFCARTTYIKACSLSPAHTRIHTPHTDSYTLVHLVGTLCPGEADAALISNMSSHTHVCRQTHLHTY
jgi:hypothetical protein